jgi:hypothetical protein
MQSLYGEENVRIAVLNRWLKLAVVVLAVTVAMALGIILWFAAALHRQTPLVIRVDALNHAQALDYRSWGMDLRDRETWGPFMESLFISYVKRHYSRYHSTFKNDFIESLYFLESSRARKEFDEWGRDQEVHDFLADPSKPETSVDASKVTLYGLETGCEDEHRPCEAIVEFSKDQQRPDGTKASRSYTSSLRFIKTREVKHDIIPVNPMGIVILREDLSEAFHEEATR